ncbi:hypothetical protein PQR72_30205 [Paraburkholderia madseniana]|uniref:hypothetical protein n=1 Tax=Paraburkholderia madseniana TaxID=2599607 RepID=UPI0015C53384|nr:hypothetical protein [Paraburkholderia madseniana]NPT68535.1 hypothetical protein [Paraburkholderia madseniana]
MADDHEQEEFFHIRKMVLELDRLVKNGDIHGLNNPVAQPDYWRKRINVLLARPTISVSIARRAAALLAQLDRIADALKKSR